MSLTFCADGYEEQVAVEVRQDDGGLHCVVQGNADPKAVRAQVARVLSLDHHGAAFVDVGRRGRQLTDCEPWRRDYVPRCHTHILTMRGGGLVCALGPVPRPRARPRPGAG